MAEDDDRAGSAMDRARRRWDVCKRNAGKREASRIVMHGPEADATVESRVCAQVTSEAVTGVCL